MHCFSGNRNKLDDIVLGNLRLGVTPDRWEGSLFMDNIADDDTVSSDNSSRGLKPRHAPAPPLVPDGAATAPWVAAPFVSELGRSHA